MNRNYIYILLLLILWYWYNNKEKSTNGEIIDNSDPRIPCFRWANDVSFEDGFSIIPPATNQPELLGDWKMYYYCCHDRSSCFQGEINGCNRDKYNVGFYWIANDNDPNKLLQKPQIITELKSIWGIVGQYFSNRSQNQMYSTMNKKVIDLMISTGEIPANANYQNGTYASGGTFNNPTSLNVKKYYNSGKSYSTIQNTNIPINHNFMVAGVRNVSNQSGATPTYTELNRVKITFDYLGNDGQLHTYSKDFYPDITEVCGSAGDGIILTGN
jgi:hypothetical protein